MGRTVAVLFLCFALVLGACADRSPEAGGPDGTNPDGTPRIVDDGSPTTTTGPGGGGGGPGTTRPGTQGGNGGTGTTRPGSPPTTTPRPQSPNHPDSGAKGPVGAFARTLLRPQPATRIVVEVMVEPGNEPRQAALDYLVATLRDVSGKQVSLSGPVPLPEGDGTTTVEEIRAMSDRHSRTPHTTFQAVVRVLYLGGSLAEERNAIGVAVRGDTAAVFKQAVRQTGSPFAPASLIEEAVLVHEIGHILGLVDLVIDTGRDDPKHEGHSTNEDSVMFWAVESSLMGQVLDGPPSRQFDAADRADLARIRNGA